MYASGRLTNSSAWQESLLIRRDATLRFREPCIWAFLSILQKTYFFSSLLRVPTRFCGGKRERRRSIEQLQLGVELDEPRAAQLAASGQ